MATVSGLQKPILTWSKKASGVRSVAFQTAVYKIIFLVCSSVLVTLSTYGVVATIMGHVDVVGATLVDVEVPSPEVLPIYAKPVSILMIAALGLTFSGFELAKPRLSRTSGMWISIFEFIAFLGIALSAYEVLYNFAIWTADIARDSLLGVLNPDVITNQYPNPKTPWNLVFATKLTTTALAIAVYAFYILRQVEKQKHEEIVP
ncbi:MAG TPA: hypothetical protein VFF30_01900 [Nitrososphaerales archaeon]|nr:hypothetical protein [Nitrososphaerales archaeon]